MTDDSHAGKDSRRQSAKGSGKMRRSRPSFVAILLGVLLLLPSASAASSSSTSTSTAMTAPVAASSVGAGGAAPVTQAPAGPAWWNPQYAYRMSINLTNPSNLPMVEHPFFIDLAFPTSHLFDAAAELRLVDQTGQEVPSYVVDEVSSGGFVASAWLLVLADLPPSATQAFELYYGNPDAAMPSYRTAATAGNITEGQVTVDLGGSAPGSPSFQVSYGGTYSQSILSKVSYSANGSSSAFGDIEIAANGEQVVSPWTLDSSSSGSLQVASSAYSAGGVRYSEAIVVSNETVVIARLLTNLGQSPASGVMLTDLVDSSSFSILGSASAAYDSSSGTFSTTVSGAWLGYSSATAVRAFEVGAAETVASDVRSGTLDNSSSSSGVTAGGLEWSLGTLTPEASAQLLTGWGIGSSQGEVQAALSSVGEMIASSIGSEESLAPASAATTLQANSYWNATLPVQNLTVSTGGTTIPAPLAGNASVSSHLTVSGTATYGVQAGFTPLSKDWQSVNVAQGNTTASASSSLWSFPLEGYTGTVRVYSPDGSGSGAAELTSFNMSFPASNSRFLVIRYLASFAGTESLSPESLYAAVDVRTSASGPFGETLLLPAIGTSTSDSSECSPLLSVGSRGQPAPQTSLVGQLIPDGSWRTLSVDLNSLVGSSAIFARVRLCAATDAPFSGQLQLDVASVGVQVESQASNFLSVSALPANGSMRLSLLPGLSYEPSSLQFNGAVSFSVLDQTVLRWGGSTTFNGTILSPVLNDSPKTSVGNGSAYAETAGSVAQNSDANNSAAVQSPQAEAALTDVTILVPAGMGDFHLYVNGSMIQGQTFNGSSSLAPLAILSDGGPLYSVSLSVRLTGYALDVNVVDSDGNPLQGAGVSLSGEAIPTINRSANNSQGSSSFLLFPGSYTVTAQFQGANVGSANVTLGSNQTVSLKASVYNDVLRIENQLGSPLAGASVVLQGGEGNDTSVTNREGAVTFKVVANQQYGVSVSVGGVVYYTGTISASVKDATFQVKTSYVPSSTELPVLSIAVIALFGGSVAFYIVTKRPGRLERAEAGSPPS
jgi:hypothetical protein